MMNTLPKVWNSPASTYSISSSFGFPLRPLPLFC